MKDHFNSRPHEEIDPASNVTAGTYLAFQLTISRGGRPDSRAFYTVAICISTHDLARRSTVRWEKQPDGENISTHDLTRRSTLRPFFHALPATFQLTTSRGGRLYTTAQPLHQNPVSTHDRARRSTAAIEERLPSGSISTHDLARRSTECTFLRKRHTSISTHDLARRSTP